MDLRRRIKDWGRFKNRVGRVGGSTQFIFLVEIGSVESFAHIIYQIYYMYMILK